MTHRPPSYEGNPLYSGPRYDEAVMPIRSRGNNVPMVVRDALEADVAIMAVGRWGKPTEVRPSVAADSRIEFTFTLLDEEGGYALGTYKVFEGEQVLTKAKA